MTEVASSSSKNHIFLLCQNTVDFSAPSGPVIGPKITKYLQNVLNGTIFKDTELRNFLKFFRIFYGMIGIIR